MGRGGGERSEPGRDVARRERGESQVSVEEFAPERDLAEIGSWLADSDSWLADIARKHPSHTLVARRDGKAAGFVSFGAAGIDLFSPAAVIAVDPTHRRQGIATKLLEELAVLALSKSSKSVVFAEVASDNEAAIGALEDAVMFAGFPKPANGAYLCGVPAGWGTSLA